MIVKHRGGEWVLRASHATDTFTPEDLEDVQKQIARTVREFVTREVLPALPAMDEHDFSHNVRLLRQAGELGLTGVDVPEAYGGLGLDKVTSALVTEEMGVAAAFSVTFGAHTGIGTLPIVFFGTRQQKEKWLPLLATAEKIAAYSLTEPNSGSDALGARTTARLSEDGQHWILNGSKQWTSNGGFADVFIVYAKVDGTKFSAFIVERDAPGLSTGKEEQKMGIRGSSTRSVILQDCTIPVDNLLHEVGKGHQIAFNILNIGRYKLGAGVIGSAKKLINIATAYALGREQFGRPIAQFPLIQQKLAEMAMRAYAAESASLRTAALLDEGLAEIDLTAEDAGQQSVLAIQEYVVECSIMKVLGSEVLNDVVDEAVQIHGGYGFMEEYEVCRAYRDSRINRIFEGTNEINRLLITGDLLKRAQKGQLPLMEAIAVVQQDLASDSREAAGNSSAREERLAEAARTIALLLIGLGLQQYGPKLEAEQEFLAGVADILIDLYAMESGLLRAAKHPTDARRDLAVAYADDAFGRIEVTARTLLASLSRGDELLQQLSMLDRLTQRTAIDTIRLKRQIASRVLAAGGYAV